MTTYVDGTARDQVSQENVRPHCTVLLCGPPPDRVLGGHLSSRTARLCPCWQMRWNAGVSYITAKIAVMRPRPHISVAKFESIDRGAKKLVIRISTPDSTRRSLSDVGRGDR